MARLASRSCHPAAPGGSSDTPSSRLPSKTQAPLTLTSTGRPRARSPLAPLKLAVTSVTSTRPKPPS